MAQYLAPGVYVEEIAGPRSIQGVGTSTAAFVGPCRYGPTSGRSELLTSYLDFARIYGDMTDLNFGGNDSTNYLALGVKGFFDEGGTSLYVARLFNFTDQANLKNDHASCVLPTQATSPPSSSGTLSPPSSSDTSITVRARFPGLAGRMAVTFRLRAGATALVGTGATATLTRVHQFDTVYAVGPAVEGVYVVGRDPVTGAWTLAGNSGNALALTHATAVYPITVVVDVSAPTVDPQGLPAFGPPTTVGEFGFDPRAAGGGITTVLAANPPVRAQGLTIPIALEGIPDTTPADEMATTIANALFGEAVLKTAVPVVPPNPPPTLADRQVSCTLTEGSDGVAPTSDTYEGVSTTFDDYQHNPLDLPQRGLAGLESIDDISIVVAPGASSGWAPASDDHSVAQAINNSVTAHCEKMQYRVAALDTPRELLPADALDFRNLRSSNYAALYYPWITIPNPSDGTKLEVPPAPYMAGIWARSDNNFGVFKAPANEVVRSAVDFEVRLNKAQQELLNPEGVNCLRFFPGPGFLVWGARTVSDDPEWKYLSMRRYFNYLEKSIDEGTQWVVFEVNGPELWDAVRHTISDFLLNEWKSGALLGAKPEQGFYVTCDASTMTQDDLDNGRLVCLIGVAAAKPAEFVIFRISQWTATATS
jgi:phage tail sheath protein FI